MADQDNFDQRDEETEKTAQEIETRELSLKQQLDEAEKAKKEVQDREQKLKKQAENAETLIAETKNKLKEEKLQNKNELSEVAEKVKELNVAAAEVVKLALEKKQAAEERTKDHLDKTQEERWLVPLIALLLFSVIGVLASLPHILGNSSNFIQGNSKGNLEISASAILEQPVNKLRVEGEPKLAQDPNASETSTEKDQAEYARIWRIKGLILSNDEPAQKAKVIALAKDELGNVFVSNTETDQTGNFHLSIVQEYSLRGKTFALIEEIQISATAQNSGFFSLFNPSSTGKVYLTPEISNGTRWITGPGAFFLSALIIFFFSIVLSLFQTENNIWIRAKYYSTVLLSVGFTALMIVFISGTIQELGGANNKHELISLGFANVFFGSYVQNSNPEWLLSLTTPINKLGNKPKSPDTKKTSAVQSASGKKSPTEIPPNESDITSHGKTNNSEVSPTPTNGGTKIVSDASREVNNTQSAASPPSRGFGAPLWVLLLSVVGSSVFTIKLVVGNLKDPIDFCNSMKVREGASEVTSHQFYILFAPLGGIFVYQLLVAAGSATETITVGLAALASGIALNAVLEKAWSGVQSFLTPQK